MRKWKTKASVELAIKKLESMRLTILPGSKEDKYLDLQIFLLKEKICNWK